MCPSDKRVETDSAEFSSLVTDLEAAGRFREETITYVSDCLKGKKSANKHEKSASNIITTFKPIGQALRSSYTAGKLVPPSPVQRLFTQDVFSAGQSLSSRNTLLFKMTEDEQKELTRENLPTVEEYLQQRLGSSAVGAFLAFTE